MTSMCPCALILHYFTLKATAYRMLSRDTVKTFLSSFTGQHGLDGMSGIFGMFKTTEWQPDSQLYFSES